MDDEDNIEDNDNEADCDDGDNPDIHYAFFGNVVRGKSALFRLVVRNAFAHFVRKVLARRKLLPGKFGVFAPLETSIKVLPTLSPGFQISCLSNSAHLISDKHNLFRTLYLFFRLYM